MAAMPAPIDHLATGELIELAPGEQLLQIAWPGNPVLVLVAHRLTQRALEGELAYRLARPSCNTWIPTAELTLEPWTPAPPSK